MGLHPPLGCGRQHVVQPQVVRFLAVVIGPIRDRDEDGHRPIHVHAEHRDRIGQLRIVHFCKGLLTKLERLLEPCDELLFGGGRVYRGALRDLDAGRLATEDVVPLVREVYLDLRETHLRRGGAIVVLVGGHRLGRGDQNAREALFHAAQSVGDWARRRGGGGGGGGGRRLAGERRRHNREGRQQSIGSRFHGQTPIKGRRGFCPNCGRGASRTVAP